MIPRTLGKKSGIAAHSYNPSTGEAEVEDPWGSLASHPALLKELQVSERPCPNI